MDLLQDSQGKTDQSDFSDYSNPSSVSGTPSQIRSFSSVGIGDITPTTRFDFDESELKAPSTPM